MLVFVTWASGKQDEATKVISVWDLRQGLKADTQEKILVQ